MSVRTPTPQQAAALAARGVSVALGAGAGCGKTSVLTDRFVGELDGPEPRPLASVVALTFTEKAARELRQRVRAACRARLDRGDPAERARWRAVLRGLEDAPIGTFHSFCGRVLRRFAIEAGLDPGFVIVEESIAPALRDEALAGCIRRWLADRDSKLIDVAVELGLDAVRSALADLLSHRDVAELRPWADRTPEELVGAWKHAFDAEVFPAYLDDLVAAGRRCMEAVDAASCNNPTGVERIRFLQENLPRIRDYQGDLGEFLQDIRGNAKIQGAGTKKQWASEAAYESAKEAFESLRKSIDRFCKSVEWSPELTLLAAKLGVDLARLALEAREAFDEAKRARGMLDFDDLLVRTRDLLRDEGGKVRRALAEEVGIILVDEFQDTDPIQADILDLLAGPDRCDGRLFLVGDFKQSIYRFRGARPELFRRYREDFPEGGRLDLSENFRSVPGVLHFVNALFADTFPGDPPLAPGGPASIPAPEPGRPAVEFLWAVDPAPDGGPAAKDPDPRRTEARWIARLVRSRIDAGWTVRDRDTGEPRPAHAGDVALLFRTLNDAAPYEAALKEAGLDFHVVGGSAFYAQQEIHDLIHVLSAVEDPLDSVSLAGALRSPFFCLSDDGLFWLASAAPGELARGLARAEAGEVPQLTSDDFRKARRAAGLLARWRAVKDREPIAGLVERVLVESGYEPALLGEFLGDRKRANARKLVRQARRFDAQGGFTLADFVARLRADLRRPPREEQASTTDERARSVRLMTIHQAKGLEFPVVVVPDLNRKPGNDPARVAFDPDLGVVVNPPEDPGAAEDPAAPADDGRCLGMLVRRAREAREDEQEALRLFYVATTRARDALFLSSATPPEERAASPAMKLLDARFDRATGRCLASLPEGWPTPAVAVVSACPPSPSDGRHRPGRVPLRAVARSILRAPRPDPSEGMPAPALAGGLVDLDPAAALPPRAARAERLARAILADPRATRPGSLEAVAARTGRRLEPAATPAAVAAAVARLGPWLRRFGPEIEAAEQVVRGLDWSAAWPPGSAEPTVYRSRIDLAWREPGPRGRWVVAAFADAAAPEPLVRLRLRLSGRVLEERGPGRVRHGWLVRLGPDGPGGLEGEERFDPASVDEAIRDFARTALVSD